MKGAFLPDPLPSEVELRQGTYRAAAEAQAALGRLDMATRQVPNPARWARYALRLEARAWAAFDGVVTLPQEAYVLGLPGAPPADGRLDQYLRACGIAVNDAARGRPLDVASLARLSQVASGSSGEQEMWRTGHGWLGGPRPADAFLVAAPPGPELWVATEQWCSWVEEQREMPLVVKSALALFQYYVLSPFPGATHMARFVMTYEALRSQALREPALPISVWMRRHHRMLPELIVGVVDRQDFDSLVVFLATAVRETCDEMIARVEAARSAFTELAERVAPRRTAVLQVLEALVADPAMDLHEVAEIGGITVTHAATLVRQLEAQEIVRLLDSRTLEQQAEDASYRKVIHLDPKIMRLLTPRALPPGTP